MYGAALVSAHFKDCVSDVNSHPSMSSAPSFLMTRVDLKNKRTKLVKLKHLAVAAFIKQVFTADEILKKDFSVQHIYYLLILFFIYAQKVPSIPGSCGSFKWMKPNFQLYVDLQKEGDVTKGKCLHLKSRLSYSTVCDCASSHQSGCSWHRWAVPVLPTSQKSRHAGGWWSASQAVYKNKLSV